MGHEVIDAPAQPAVGQMAVRDHRASAVAEQLQPEFQPTGLMQALVEAAKDPRTDVAKVKELYALHKEQRAWDAEAAFNAAMARTQRKLLPIARDRFNDQTNSWYATQAALCEAAVPIYSAEGLFVSYDSDDCPRDGFYRTVAIVGHEMGHSRRYHYDLPLDDAGIKGTTNKTKVHAAKSTTTYSRNTLFCMIFNIATRDKAADDDGNGAGRTKQQERQKPSEKQPYDEAQFNKNLPEWRSLVTGGKTTPEKILAKVESKFLLLDKQRKAIRDLGKKQEAGAQA